MVAAASAALSAAAALDPLLQVCPPIRSTNQKVIFKLKKKRIPKIFSIIFFKGYGRIKDNI